MSRLQRLLWLFAVALPLIYLLDTVTPRFYRFSPAKLQQLARSAIEQHRQQAVADLCHGSSKCDDVSATLGEVQPDPEAIMILLVDALQSEYPNLIEPFDRSRWVFHVGSGGGVGGVMILHASLTEYIILFGSAMGTEGHGGVHLTDDYFTTLTGQHEVAKLGDVRPQVFLPGEQSKQARGVALQYRMGNGTWALEIAQGLIPTMMPFGLASLPLTFDFDSLIRTLWYSGSLTTRHLLRGKV